MARINELFSETCAKNYILERHITINNACFIFEGFSISQNAFHMTGSPPSPQVCSHLLLLLPILLISTTSPPLKHTSFSVSGKQEDNSNSIVSVARQILQNLEVHVLPISRQLKYEKDRLVSLKFWFKV